MAVVAEGSMQEISSTQLKSEVDPPGAKMDLCEDLSGAICSIPDVAIERFDVEGTSDATSTGPATLSTPPLRHLSFEACGAGVLSMNVDQLTTFNYDSAILGADGGLRPIVASNVTVKIKNPRYVVQGDNTRTTIVYKQEYSERSSVFPNNVAVQSDGPAPQHLKTPPHSRPRRRKKRPRPEQNARKTRRNPEAHEARRRLYFGGVELATAVFANYASNHTTLADLIDWCKLAIDYLLDKCGDQESYGEIKRLLETAKTVAEGNFEKCVSHIQDVLNLSGDDLVEREVVRAEVQFVLALFYLIRSKPKLAVEQLKQIDRSRCSDEQRCRILLQIGETLFVLLAQDFPDCQSQSECQSLMAETETYFREILSSSSDKQVIPPAEKQTMEDACHLGMARLLLGTDIPLTRERRAPPEEIWKRAGEHVAHLERRTSEFCPLMECRYFLVDTYYQYFAGNFARALTSATRAKKRALERTLDRDLATAAIGVLHEILPNQSQADSSLCCDTELNSGWESCLADLEDNSDHQDELCLSEDSDSD